MKLSYNYYRRFRGLFSVGIILAVITLLSSCSSELPDLSLDQIEDNENTVESQDPSLLRFQTIEELENISVADIPGDHDGFELKELSYECVDTIELRALLFDVKAKLGSGSNHEKVISFAAEVGPELVSVEYYPGGEMVPAHHNMMTAFYPKVERYRNYSDGSRIGPDEFYDYGHPIFLSVGLDGAGGDELFYGITDYCYEEIPHVIDYNINPESEWYENGTYYSRQKATFEYNLNTIIIDERGKTYTGEDLLPVKIKSGVYDINSRYIQEDWLHMINNYYQVPTPPNTGYTPSRIIDNNDSEMKEIFNLCCDVEDLSPKPYPMIEKELDNGWYFCPSYDRWSLYNTLNSVYFDSLDFNEIGLTTWGVGCLFEFYSQYLVIDGRIIHYDDFISKDYSGIKNIKQSERVEKVSDGYLAQLEVEASLYGERFKSLFDLHIRTHYGPSVIIDRSNIKSVEDRDNEEMNKINNGLTRSEINDNYKSDIKGVDRKIHIVDKNLPKSIINVKKINTLKKEVE